MKNILQATLAKTLIGLVIFLPSMCFALPTELLSEFPTEFTATYTLESYGIVVARATYTLEHESNGLKFTQYSKPVGLAALFKKETVQETSYLSLHNGRLLLDEYSYIQKGSNKNRDINLKIDWIVSDKKLSGRIRGTARDNPIQLKVNKPVWDTLSFQIPVMMNANEKNPDWEATILVKGQLKNYTFVTHKTEEITVSGHTLKTIKVERKNENNDKPIFFWIAPGLSNLPIKIEKWKKGKASVTMLLDAATFPSEKKLQFKSIEELDDL
jgi:hypothetical protein